MTVQLYDYQESSVEALRGEIRKGNRKPILVSPAGSGKTEIACSMIREAVRKGSRIGFMVDRVSLVDQVAERFDSYGIRHGVMQASHWNWNPMTKVQVCSAQTVERRKGFNWDDFDLIFVDECHDTRRFTVEQIRNSTRAVTIGLTATPFTRGLGEIYNGMVNLVTTNELIARGFLTPLKVFMAKPFDVTGLKIVAGEWSADDIAERGMAIVGDIVNIWESATLEHFGKPEKTLVFAATVDHGAKLVEEFQAKGYDFRQISYKGGNDDDRRRIIEEFRKPDSNIHGLVSCEVFTKGFDVPDVKIGISARPYRSSLKNHIQQMGRLQRRAPGKTFGVWIDCSGNYMRFYKDTERVFEHGVENLNDASLQNAPRKEPTEKERAEIVCACGYALRPSDSKCPRCGKERRKRLIEELPGSIGEVVTAAQKANRDTSWDDKVEFMAQLASYEITQGYKPGWAAHKYRERYGVWPNDPRVKNVQPKPCGEIVSRWIKSRNIRYAKARKSA